jgi:hypothetical protein
MDDQRVDRAGGAVKHRNKRIEWSALWVAATILMSLLWLRRYGNGEGKEKVFANNTVIGYRSFEGAVVVYCGRAGSHSPP